ncbi:hypothetical protein [Dongia rigui]|uniref:hypothetical protein n=1 Tax=Dongia rigui TaxID=940149 RepID=UPI002A69F267|nr:hypothetical protein [Dongia rigui]
MAVLAAALTLSPLAMAHEAMADGSVKVVPPTNPSADLQLKSAGGGVKPDVHCSTVPSQTLQPCTGDFKAWCKAVGGTYGSTANKEVDACFSTNEW